MRKKEIEHITPLTQYSISFLASLGHNCHLLFKRENSKDDVFLVDGNKILRKNFYEFARKRHKTLRYHHDMFYNMTDNLYTL